jgi:hypothetical protein
MIARKRERAASKAGDGTRTQFTDDASASDPAPQPGPRLPSRPLLLCSGLLFAIWTVVLILLATRS